MSDNSIDLVIINLGDGSNGIKWVIDEEVIELMEEMADEGDERYASGDGLQVRTEPHFGRDPEGPDPLTGDVVR